MNTINVVFIADEGYVTPTCVAITSLIENRNKMYKYNIHVVVPLDISDRSKELFGMSAKNISNVEIFITESSSENLKGLHANENKKFIAATETALQKFKLPELFPMLDRILYLDGDILVRDDLVELYNIDLKGKSLAAVRDLPQVLYKEQVIGKEINGREYFNSGVMLLDLRKMRELKSSEMLIEAKKNSQDFSLMDQNVFNTIFADDMIQLPFQYNACYINLVESAKRYDIEKLNELYGTHYVKAEDIASDIKIMHFSSKLKPWLFFDVPLADEWIYYYKKSVLCDVPLQRIFHTQRNIDMVETKSYVNKLSNEKNEFEQTIPVVFATNKEYAPYVAVAIQSIYENSDKKKFYDVNILIDASMTNNLKEKFNKITYSNISIKMWDVRKCFEGVNLYSVGHYSRQMYFRWLIPEIFTKYEKVIYLDCDIVVEKDLSELYSIDIGENYIGAINNFLRSNLENYISNRLKLRFEQYYNSGILVINTRQFILNNVKKRCIDCLAERDKLACPDQDVLNIVCKGNIYKINDTWNYQWHHQFADAVKGEFLLDYNERFKNLRNGSPSIIHYTSHVKPWNSPARPQADIFWNYCRKTIFYEEILFNMIAKKAEESAVEACKTRVSNPVKEENLGNQSILINQNNYFEEEVKRLRYEIGEIRNSFSYKIGHAITLLPRWIRYVLLDKPM